MLLEVLILGALMGILGQGARAVVGLKGMSDNAKALDLSPNDLFEAARLVTSFLIGFLVGLAAAIVYIKNFGVVEPDWQALVGFAASGYLGTDFLEGFISQYLPIGSSNSTVQKLVAAQAARTALLQKVSTFGVAAPAAIPPQRAQDIVFGVILQRFPNAKVSADQSLSQYGYTDAISLVTLADDIYAASKVYIKAQDIITCTKISEVISLVQKAG